MKLTGISQLDDLVNPVYKHWIVELYGDQYSVLSLLHYVVAYRSNMERVYVLFNIEFGGLDTLYLVKLCRVFDCRLDNVFISRAFRLDDTVRVLEELADISSSLILVVYPYSYVSKNPSRYHEATRITGLLSRISVSNQVLLFNTTTRHGRYMPEGGSFHHHVVKVIVKLTRQRDSIIAELVKHPAKDRSWRSIPLSLLEHPVKPMTQLGILEWIKENKESWNTANTLRTESTSSVFNRV